MCIMADQQFCLRWNNHQSTLVSVFDTLLEKNVLVDCTLAAEGQYLKAHKVVLCACSPYLETLLSDHAEKHPIIILKDVKYQELKNMMDYMYKGEVNISQDDLEMFLKTAESLQIKGLTDGAGEHSKTTKRYDQQHRKQQQLLPSSSNLPQLPSGLTVESTKSSRDSVAPSVSNSVCGSREGSISPIARKRRRPRSQASNSFDDNSMPYDASPVSLVSTINNSRKSVEDDLINVRISQQSTFVKEEIEPECDIIEPKSEYLQELNKDNILTLADDDDTVNGVDIETGSSHAGDSSNHMYSWPHLDDRSPNDVYGTPQHGDNQEKKGRRGRPPGSKNRKTALKKNDSNEIYYYGDWCSPDEDNWQANSKVKRNRGRPPKRETIVKAELEQEYLNYPYFDENKQADLANRLNISVAYVSRWYEKRKNDMGRPRRGRPRKSVDTFSGSPIFCQTVLEGDSENGHFSDAYFTAEERNILYNDFQKTELMKEFRKSPYISINEETALSKKLGLSEFQIRAWFSRMRFKANFSDSSAELTVGDFSNDDDDDRIKEEQANDNSIADGAIESNVTGFQSELDNDPNNVVNSSSAGSSPTHSIEQLTSEQVEKLEATYSISPTISYVMLNNLSNELRVSKKCIDDWFRAKRDDSKTESIVNVTDL